MRIRDGPAAVRGEASAPRRHWPTGWEGGGAWTVCVTVDGAGGGAATADGVEAGEVVLGVGVATAARRGFSSIFRPNAATPTAAMITSAVSPAVMR